MPSERVHRRTDKEIRRRSGAADFEVITASPVAKDDANSTLLKLHILNVRTGKIQDAIISSELREFLQPKSPHKKSSSKSSDKNRPLLFKPQYFTLQR